MTPAWTTLVRALLGREDCRFDDAIARIYALHRGARGDYEADCMFVHQPKREGSSEAQNGRVC